MHPKHVCHNATNQKQTRYIPSHGNGSAKGLEFGAPRAEVAAPSGVEERDAQALYRSFTRFCALFNVRDISRRVLEVSFSGVRVTCDVGADLLPYAWFPGWRPYVCSIICVC